MESMLYKTIKILQQSSNPKFEVLPKLNTTIVGELRYCIDFPPMFGSKDSSKHVPGRLVGVRYWTTSLAKKKYSSKSIVTAKTLSCQFFSLQHLLINHTARNLLKSQITQCIRYTSVMCLALVPSISGSQLSSLRIETLHIL